MQRKIVIFLFLFLGVSIVPVFSSLAQEPQEQNAKVLFGAVPETVESEKTFDLDIVIDPNGTALDTVRVNLQFTPGILLVDHFQRGSLFPNASPGNSIDNTNGFLSEGGFTLSGPVTEKGVFGTLTLKALKQGKAEVEALATSRLISDGEEKIDTGTLPKVAITVSSADIQAGEDILRVSPFVSSLTHKEQEKWYQERRVEFTWRPGSALPVAGYFVAFDQGSTTDPSDIRASDETTFVQENVQDGVWYFHIKAQLQDKSFSGVEHYKVQIDGTPPRPIVPVIERLQLNEGEENTISFGTTDDTSGIDHYEISLNNAPYQVQESPVSLQNLAAGDYIVKVKAGDRANNVIFGQSTFRVYPGTLQEGIEAGVRPEAGFFRSSLWIIILFTLVIISGIILLTLQKKKQ